MSKIEDAAKNLPSDPAVALSEFADRVQAIYSGMPGPLSFDDALFVMKFIERFREKFELDIRLERRPIGAAADSKAAMNVVSQIQRQKEQLVGKYIEAKIEAVLEGFHNPAEPTFGLAHLNAEEKKKILQHLEKIRLIVEAGGLSDRKKNALFERLAALVREVNTHGTRTDRFFSFAGDLGFVLGDMTNKAKPLFDEVKEMLRIVSRSRARQEGVSLPPGDEVLSLPKPENADDKQ